MLQPQDRETTAAEVFGHNVRRYREKQGMSRFRLAINAALDDRQIRDIENGTHNPTLLTMERIAAAPGVDMPRLFEQEQDTPGAFPLEALQPAFDRLPLAEQGRVLAVLRLLLQVSKE